MSIAHRTWAAVCSPTDGVRRAVLEQLADYADENGVAWPSVATVAELSGWSERGVQKALRQLEADGVIVAEPAYVRQARRPGAHTTAYRLVVTLCRHDGQPDPSASWASRCTHRSGKGVQRVRPPRRPSGTDGGASGAPPGGAGRAPVADGEGVNDVREGGAPETPGGARRAPEPPENHQRTADSPPSTVSPSARETPAPLPNGEAPLCTTCRTHHHPSDPHLEATRRPDDFPPLPTVRSWKHTALAPDGTEVDVEEPPEDPWSEPPLFEHAEETPA